MHVDDGNRFRFALRDLPLGGARLGSLAVAAARHVLPILGLALVQIFVNILGGDERVGFGKRALALVVALVARRVGVLHERSARTIRHRDVKRVAKVIRHGFDVCRARVNGGEKQLVVIRLHRYGVIAEFEMRRVLPYKLDAVYVGDIFQHLAHALGFVGLAVRLLYSALNGLQKRSLFVDDSFQCVHGFRTRFAVNRGFDFRRGLVPLDALGVIAKHYAVLVVGRAVVRRAAEKIVLFRRFVVDDLGRPQSLVEPRAFARLENRADVLPRFHIAALIANVAVSAVKRGRRVHVEPAVVGVGLVVYVYARRVGALCRHVVQIK